MSGKRQTRGEYPRTISYSGCWTCRKRRIKCDERTNSCMKCEEAGLICAGYGIRLSWPGDLNVVDSKRGGSRMRINPEPSIHQHMTDEELTRTLSMLDKEPRTQTTVGPFSVFSLHPSTNDCIGPIFAQERKDYASTSPTLNDDTIPNFQESPGQNLISPCSVNDSSECLSQTDQVGVSSPHNTSLYSLFNCEITYPDEDGFDETIEKSRVDPTTHDANFGEDETDQDLVDDPTRVTRRPSDSGDHSSEELSITAIGGVQLTLLDKAASSPYHGKPSFMAGKYSFEVLINHYAEHVAHLMQPVTHRNNPFRSLYLPLAIEGSFDLGGYRNLTFEMSARAAVFHSLLTTAAFHMLGLGLKNQGLERIAFYHKQQALVGLRNALSKRTNTYKELMIGVLSLVSVDILDGGIYDHWIHLEAGFRLQASRHNSSLVSQETGQLNAICTMLRLFSQTAQPTPEPLPWNQDDPWSQNTAPDYSNPSIEYLYGITSTLAGLIDKIYRTTQSLSYYKKQAYPPALMEACEALGDELCGWVLSAERFSAVDSDEQQALKVAQAQAQAFHCASLIYYYRSVQNCDKSRLSIEQEATLAAMNEAEDLKSLFCERNSRPAPISWPAYIASCEAVGDHRKEWDKWWLRVQKYQLKSFSKQHSTIHQIWDILDQGQPHSDWRKALDTIGTRIIPV